MTSVLVYFCFHPKKPSFTPPPPECRPPALPRVKGKVTIKECEKGAEGRVCPVTVMSFLVY